MTHKTKVRLPNTGAISGLIEATDFFQNPNFANDRFAKYGDIFETKLIGQRLIFIRGDQAISDLLEQQNAVEGWWPASVRKLLGSRSLANRNGPAHKARRRVVGQLFSGTALKRYSPDIVIMVNELAEKLPLKNDPTPLAISMRRFAFSVIAKTVLGLDNSNCEALFLDFELWTKALFSIPLAIPGTPFAKALSARQRLLERLKTVLAEADGRRGGLDLLADGLDEHGFALTDDDLVEQLLLLLFAGYETTASSLTCLMRALLIEDNIKPWLMEEMEDLSWPPQENISTAYDASCAPRLNALVDEVMRMMPPVGGFFRKTRTNIILAGVEIPKDRVIQVALAASNRHGEGDLDRFRPQRHLDGSLKTKLVPFGGGERVCLGKALAELEIRLMVVGLLKQVRLKLITNQDLSLQLIPSPSPKDGLLLTAEQR